MPENSFPHIHLEGPTDSFHFTSTSQMGADKRIPSRDRQSHAIFLQRQLEKAWQEAENEFVASHAERHGVYLEFQSSAGFELVTKSLEDMNSKKVRLCNVRKDERIVVNEENGQSENLEITYATIYVSNEKRQQFFNKIEKYLNEDTIAGNPKNANLINGIDDLRKALLIDSFWQDDRALIPGDESEWCEVWLSSDTPEVRERFESLMSNQNINSKPGFIQFPERTVKLVHVSREQLENLSRLSDDIAEYRRAKDTAGFFIESTPRDQTDWVNDLTERLVVDRESQVSICILDTGINNGHPLLSPILDSSDCHSVDPSWGVDDHQGHGSLMAGLAGYGDLKQHLESSSQVEINHILESVKILPPTGQNDPELWGDITAQGISRAEVQAPLRKRISCMAITSEDTRDRGHPSSWSGALDQIISGVGDNTKRLVIVSAGNITDFSQIANYPHSQITDSIHDPAQSWNSLSVGAFTQLTELTDPTLEGYNPIARVNQLSPFSTTSLIWEDKWPIKPEVVFEGGNAAVSPSGFVTECEDLSLVSTHYQPTIKLLEAFRMTSAATSQAAYFAAQIQVQYPEYWPETIRALIVHSAEWPEELKQQFARNDSKTEMKNVLRACGYGVPNLERALYCSTNSLTLIAEAEIQPYERFEGKNRTRDMHLYELPWPADVLQELGELQVEMRITLSYFIEPGPGEVGWKDRYRYASHIFRFDINSPGESRDEFVQRINTATREEDEGHPGTSSASEYWTLGRARNKGSIHSDIWKGTAADLAASNLVSVSPRIGWWRERNHLGKCETLTRYTLVVSIHTPEQDIDIYTPVAQQISLTVPVSIGSR